MSNVTWLHFKIHNLKILDTFSSTPLHLFIKHVFIKVSTLSSFIQAAAILHFSNFHIVCDSCQANSHSESVPAAINKKKTQWSWIMVKLNEQSNNIRFFWQSTLNVSILMRDVRKVVNEKCVAHRFLQHFIGIYIFPLFHAGNFPPQSNFVRSQISACLAKRGWT